MARQTTPIELRVRLYRGRDADLIDWMEGFNDQPFGAKFQAIKIALLWGIAEETVPRSDTRLSLDLGMVRQVVESVTESSLARLGGVSAQARLDLQAEDEETEGWITPSTWTRKALGAVQSPG